MSVSEDEKRKDSEEGLSEQLDTAAFLAAKWHRGQKDKQGVNYILHPIAVMMSANTIEEKILALLHDIVEDTEMTLEGLKAEGFSEAILEAVDVITRRNEEDYRTYILRVKQNDLARRVKLLDLRNNLRKGCPKALQKRYEEALEILQPRKNRPRKEEDE